MSTQTAPQTAGTPAQTVAAPEASVAKKGKITDRVVSNLRTLGEGQTMTISELGAKMPEIKRQTLQATLSQMVKAGRVEKVKTGKRQPGYKVPAQA